ncbi:ATP-binding protein [Bradyrhizobium erythrophlei]|uniref:Predicted ATPase n=1 Tax=Bradyrhizobium erythrophlei TaxID=1437360 RepID=A0A1M5XZS6_9BRAD|nr:winged helix-turn-helix domain-containing protein [Bradyrhizobium erythrophlei]SHI05300.1 Predicted ATPase [Bradyrhizobium erythrophlei]
MSEASANLVYACEQWEIDLGRRELRSRGIPVPFGGRAFEIVKVLVQSATELVTKDHMMERVWPGAIVGEGTLHVHISAVRKALGPDRGLPKTASGRGYRLLGSWTPQQREGTAPPVYSPLTRTSGAPPANNLLPLITRLIGRTAAAQFVRDLVSAYRVVTLTGPGGIGKTSLAIEAVRYLLPDFEDGGWIVELASLSDPGLVPSTVASTLGLKLAGEISADSVARAVGGRHLLLVLDNCEHVIDAVANLAETFTRLCPRTTIVATSREVLRIDGESVYRVPPLDVPAPGQAAPDYILQYSAVELFIARTKALNAGFSPHAEDLASIATICRRLDGIPLAIEFAAARAAVLGVQLVAAGLRDRFALLTAGRRTALPRQRTLRATLDWSHELLPETERWLLRRLAVFPGGFTIDAAVAVMTDTGFDASAVLDGIANLIAKSWVALDKSGAAARWTLLETIRAYALEKLVEHAEAGIAAEHHALYFRDLFTPQARGARSSLSDEDLARHVREIDNVRAALDWSFSSAGDQAIGIDLTVAYAPVWRHLSQMSECSERCERALLSLEPHVTANMPLRMELQINLASAIFITMGSPEQAKALLIEALATADALNDLNAQAGALSMLISIYFSRGEYGRAQIAAERIEQIAHRIGDPIHLRFAYQQMAATLLTRGRSREAQQYLERVLRFSAASGDRRDAIYYNSNDHAADRATLAAALWMQGFTDQALNEARLSLKELQGADHPLLLCRTLYGISRMSKMTGDFATADREIARLIEVAKGSNAHLWETAAHFLKGKLLVERGEFAQGLLVLRDAFETCDRTGWHISYEEYKGALALGLAGIGRLDEALIALDDAMAADRKGAGGRGWYAPELFRIKGEVLLQQAADQLVLAAEDCFTQAAQMVREQGALFGSCGSPSALPV